MDSDRELLQAAAKAAGIDAEVHSELGIGEEGLWLKGERSPDNSKYWNPLRVDGDALRLAVKLRLSVSVDDRPAGVVRVYVPDDKVPAQDEPATPDPYAATRRAIVRAAAELGRRGGE